MANTKLIFCGTDDSNTADTQLVCFKNEHNKIFIEIMDPTQGQTYNFQFICLDKSTAIKLHRELKKQISYIVEDVDNE